MPVKPKHLLKKEEQSPENIDSFITVEKAEENDAEMHQYLFSSIANDIAMRCIRMFSGQKQVLLLCTHSP
jgi:hypothetical protein